MASVTSYLLVTNVDDVEDVESNSLIDEYELEKQGVTQDGEGEIARITFVREYSLENQDSLRDAARRLSSSYPNSVVVLCRAEERFDHIERLNTQLYIGGKRAGDIEHGYVLNVGS